VTGNRTPKKELKVTIPTELHLQLLRMKFLKGQPIGVTVEVALRAYFAELGDAPELSQLERELLR